MSLFAEQFCCVFLGKILLSADADVRRKNNSGSTALIWAAENGHLQVTEVRISM